MRRTHLLAISVLLTLLAATTAPAAAGRGDDRVMFAGYEWEVKSSQGRVGPGPNVFSTDNVKVDKRGRLQLRVSRRKGQWRSAEVILSESLGYGTYRFTVESSLDDLDPNVVLGLFTWSDEPEQFNRELDIEFSRWGDPADPMNAGYTVQPYTAPGHQFRWQIGADRPTVHEIRWTPGEATFTSTRGGQVLSTWTFADPSAVPDPDTAHARMNLWLFRGDPPLEGRGIQVTISDFAFVPLGAG